MVRRTVPILARITRSSVDGRPICTTCGTDQQVIRTGVDGALDEKAMQNERVAVKVSRQNDKNTGR